jgi:DNA-directed RNA polymerase subunit H
VVKKERDKQAEFDVTKHELVPKHEILPGQKVEKVLKKYRVKAHQLPRIKASDPAAKAIGAKAGDVLKITRESPTAGRAIAYRYVIKG